MHEGRERSQPTRGDEKHATIYVWNEELLGETWWKRIRERGGERKAEAEAKWILEFGRYFRRRDDGLSGETAQRTRL